MSTHTAIILVDDTPIPEAAVLTQLDVIREVGRIATAQLTFQDGDSAQRTFTWSEEDLFVPGKEVEIQLRYEGEEEQTVFKGLIVRHQIEASLQGSSLVVHLKDAAIKMAMQRKRAVFNEVSDAQVFTTLIEGSGLTVGTISDTVPIHPELVQYDCSDWDMLMARADYQGLWVMTKDGTVEVIDPSSLDIGTPVYRYEFGVDEIYGFHFDANAEHQADGIVATGWSVSNQAELPGAEASAYTSSPGDVLATDLAKSFGGAGYELRSLTPLAPEELDNWAMGHLRRTRDSLVRGSLTIPGDAAPQVGEAVELAGLGKRFNGNTLITGLRHRFSVGGWSTDLQVGRSPHAFAQRTDIQSPSAHGLLPGVRGLQIGKVEPFEEDPLSEFRIKVKVPALGEEAPSVWARLISPDAGNERGYFFVPEPGDEVMLGFLNDDPRFPVVVGSLYSSSLVPPVPNDQINEDNFHKGIFTKTGMKLSFDDENSALIVQTSDDQAITLHETDGTLEIKDVNGNSMLMDSGGITITSAADLKIEASGKITISGSEVDVQ